MQQLRSHLQAWLSGGGAGSAAAAGALAAAVRAGAPEQHPRRTMADMWERWTEHGAALMYEAPFFLELAAQAFDEEAMAAVASAWLLAIGYNRRSDEAELQPALAAALPPARLPAARIAAGHCIISYIQQSDGYVVRTRLPVMQAAQTPRQRAIGAGAAIFTSLVLNSTDAPPPTNKPLLTQLLAAWELPRPPPAANGPEAMAREAEREAWGAFAEAALSALPASFDGAVAAATSFARAAATDADAMEFGYHEGLYMLPWTPEGLAPWQLLQLRGVWERRLQLDMGNALRAWTARPAPADGSVGPSLAEGGPPRG